MSISKRIRYLRKYLSDKAAFIKAGGIISHNYPIYEGFKKQAGTASGYYFHQDLLVKKLINKAKPETHINVESSTRDFVAHVASYRKIDVIDICPCNISTVVKCQAT